MTPTSTNEDTPSIGRTLKACREGKNISVNDIASKMHLDVKIINAIEEDNFSSLPDAIYVRGYIRSYSKLLGADADGLVKLYEQHGGDFEPEIIPEIRHPSQTSSSDKPVKAFTYLITLVLVVLVIAWWQSNFIINAPTSTSDSIPSVIPKTVSPSVEEPVTTQPSFNSSYTSSLPTQTTETAPAYTTDTSAGMTNMTSLQPQDPAAVLPGAIPPTSGLVPSNNLNANSSPDNTATSLTLSANPVTAQVNDMPSVQTTTLVNNQIQTIAETQTGVTPLPAQGVTSSAQPTVYQTTGPDLIVLKLTADSWIEIVDATNTKVFFNLGRPGDIYNVRGTAPFSVLLGFAQAVSIEYNGSPFNAAPFSRAGVARFTLGQ